jgi:hypothetical protein
LRKPKTGFAAMLGLKGRDVSLMRLDFAERCGKGAIKRARRKGGHACRFHGPVETHVEGAELLVMLTITRLVNIQESWPCKFGQDDKQNFCLTTGTLEPANQDRDSKRANSSLVSQC